MSTNSVAVTSLDAGIVAFTTKKGDLKSITPEGALFKGGAALTALKDVAMEVALNKAAAGRYRPSADILGAAFPKVQKLAEEWCGVAVWTNKEQFSQFVLKCHKALPGRNGYTKAQIKARIYLQAVAMLLSLKLEDDAVIEAKPETAEA